MKASYRPPLVLEVAEFARLLQVAASARVLYFRTEFAGSHLRVISVEPMATCPWSLNVYVSEYELPFVVGEYTLSPKTFHGLVDGKESHDFVPPWLQGGAL